jgi:hypothetical protein
MLVVGAAVALWSSCATAQEAGALGQDTEEKIAVRICAADISARCDFILGGQDRLRACVKERFKELSIPCQARLARLATINTACAGDIKQSCGGIQRGRSRVEACLRSMLDRLSEPCREALAQVVAVPW